MNRTLLPLAAALALVGHVAAACPIAAADLSQRLQALPDVQAVSAANLMDRRSQEPIRRYVATFADGSIVVLEQKHCEVENLTATLFATEAVPGDAALAHLSNALASSDVWQREFGEAGRASLDGVFRSDRARNGMDSGNTFEMSLEDSLASGGGAETALIYSDLSADGDSIASATTIYVGVGGM